ncbi:MAG: DegV family protein [Clostridia bacterium]|nr:DegV family protein [Clostridia bacterium]
MAKFFVSTDSTCDLFLEERQSLNIGYAPLINTIGDGDDMKLVEDNYQSQQDYVDFFNILRNGTTVKTSMLNGEQHKAYFTSLAEQGVKDCIHFCISYGLARTIEVATEAATQVKKNFPKFNVKVCESHSATVGQGILVKMACQCRDKGMTLDETYRYIQNNKNKLQHFILVDNLDHLRRGGRISGAAAAVGKMLNLKIIIEFDKDGKLSVTNKIIGKKKAVDHIVKSFARFTHDSDFYPTVVHCDNLPLAQELHDKLQTEYGIDPEIRIMGPTIGCHVGPDAVAFAFLSNQEKIK